MGLEKLIDDFVAKINERRRPPLEEGDVPQALREKSMGGRFFDWKIAKANHLHRIGPLQEKLPANLPPSYRYLISNYSFPAFEFGGVMLFANTGENIYWELGGRIFGDTALASVLFHAGLIPFGAPRFSNYDPVCFDTRKSQSEYPVVQVDHEAALGRSEIVVVKQIADSFLDLIRRLP